MSMNQNHVLPEPGHEEYAKCATLVAKVMIRENHQFAVDEIELAQFLCKFQWNPNVTDFLYVVAGIFQPGEDVPEAHAALVFPLKQCNGGAV